MSDDPEFSASEDGGQKKNSSAERPPRRFDEVSPLDLLLVLSRGRGLILLSVIGFGLLGGIYTLGASPEYTATSQLVREAQSEDGVSGLPSGLPSLQGLGVNLGGGGGGLVAASYPEIATSREVRLAVARDTFYFPSTERRTTFVRHVNRPAGVLDHVLNLTVYLPWTVKDWIGEFFEDPGRSTVRPEGKDAVIDLTEEEEEAIETLDEMVSATVSESGALEGGTGLMTISTIASDPKLAAELNKQVIKHLEGRVREIRTENTRENLDFIRERFQEAGEELEVAENELSQFLEENRSVLTGGGAPKLDFRRDRLRREVQFKEQLYSQLQKQVTQTRIKLQREQPVVTIAERPIPPPNPSAPNRVLIIVVSILLGSIIGVGGTILRSSYQGQGDDEGRRKIEEIKRAVSPAGLLQGMRQELGWE